MRYLHVVSQNEAFVASGVYHYAHDGLMTGVTESWTIHEFPDGANMIRVDYDARATHGESVLIEAWRSPVEPANAGGGQIERIDISAFGPVGAAIQHARVTYSLFETSVEIGRTLNGGERVYTEQPWQPAAILVPGGIAALGQMLGEGAINGEVTALVAHWSFADEASFDLTQQQWQVKPIGEVIVSVDGQRLVSLRHAVTRPEAAWMLALDTQGTVLHASTETTEITLSRYARRHVVDHPGKEIE